MNNVFYPYKFCWLYKYNYLPGGMLIDFIGLSQPLAGISLFFSQILKESPLKSHSENNSEQLGSNIFAGSEL